MDEIFPKAVATTLIFFISWDMPCENSWSAFHIFAPFILVTFSLLNIVNAPGSLKDPLPWSVSASYVHLPIVERIRAVYRSTSLDYCDAMYSLGTIDRFAFLLRSSDTGERLSQSMTESLGHPHGEPAGKFLSKGNPSTQFNLNASYQLNIINVRSPAPQERHDDVRTYQRCEARDSDSAGKRP